MARSFVFVHPATEANKVRVAVDEIGTQDSARIWPYYKLAYGADGETFVVGYEQPLPTLPSTHMYSKGVVTGHEHLRKFGANLSVPTAERFIEAGVTTETAPYLPTSAVTVEAISADANDDSGGTGAQTITIEGLDANFNRQSDTITMNGLSATTATTNTYLRIYRAYVSTVGTYAGNNVGAITVRASSAGTRFLSITAGAGQSQCAHYTVAAGHGLFIKDIHITAETAKSTSLYLWKIEGSDDVTTPFSPKLLVQEYIGIAGSPDFEYQPEIYLPEKSDIWVTGLVAAATGAISVEINGILETA